MVPYNSLTKKTLKKSLVHSINISWCKGTVSLDSFIFIASREWVGSLKVYCVHNLGRNDENQIGTVSYQSVTAGPTMRAAVMLPCVGKYNKRSLQNSPIGPNIHLSFLYLKGQSHEKSGPLYHVRCCHVRELVLHLFDPPSNSCDFLNGIHYYQVNKTGLQISCILSWTTHCLKLLKERVSMNKEKDTEMN